MITADNCTNKMTTLEHYPDLLSVQDLSEILGISKQTVYKEIKKGTFGNLRKWGRVYRIPKLYIINNFILGYQLFCCTGRLFL